LAVEVVEHTKLLVRLVAQGVVLEKEIALLQEEPQHLVKVTLVEVHTVIVTEVLVVVAVLVQQVVMAELQVHLEAVTVELELIGNL
jgi:hypothetical protein